MEKYLKFTLFEKEIKDKKYQKNPYRAVNFDKDVDGNLKCPAGRTFTLSVRNPLKVTNIVGLKKSTNVRAVKAANTKNNAVPEKKNRTIQLNRELTQDHQEVF